MPSCHWETLGDRLAHVLTGAHAIWHVCIEPPICHWEALGGGLLCDWLSLVLAGGHASRHGLNKPIVSHWDVVWQCVVCTTIVRHAGEGSAVCAIETHVVYAGGSETVGEVVGVAAVFSSTEGNGELIAGGECHCKACVSVCVVFVRYLGGSVKLN